MARPGVARIAAVWAAVGREPFLAEVPTEYRDGEWCWPTDDSDPAAVITYGTTPHYETGHVGWSWWALGEMGDAESYGAAKTAAEAVIARHL